MAKIAEVDKAPMHAINLVLLSSKKTLYADKHTKTYGNNVATTEILASSSK
jgi:hypothetical protein